MWRERVLQILLALLGLVFVAGIYPLKMFWRQDPALAMMLSVYVTLGIFLLMAARDPSAHRSLIAFTAWSSFAHASVMAVQASRNVIPHRELMGVVVLAVVGLILIALAPRKRPLERASAAGVLG